MTNRITKRHLVGMIEALNKTTNSPLEPYTKGSDGTYHANIGNYHLSQAYGGYALYRMVNPGGGVNDIFSCGHTTARDLYNRIHAYLAALRDHRD